MANGDSLSRRWNDKKLHTSILIELGKIAASVIPIGFIIAYMGSNIWMKKDEAVKEHKELKKETTELNTEQKILKNDLGHIKKAVDRIEKKL